MIEGERPEPRDRRRGPYRKSIERRREILDAALLVFGRSGYRSGSIREIAELVGMSAPGLLHHFGTKDALLIAVLRHRQQVDRDYFADRDAQGAGALISLVEAAERNARRRGLIELYSVLSAEATSADHPAHAYFTERYNGSRAFIGGAFEELAALGQLRPDVDPVVATRSTIALMDGLQIQWLLDGDSVDMPGDLAVYLQSLVSPEAWALALARRGQPAPPARPGRSAPAPVGHRGATIQDVADATGVSIASVSRALNGKPGVSASTRAAVLAAAGELGFTGNATARALKLGRTGRIALTVPELHAADAALIISGAAEALQKAGHSLAVGTTGADGGRIVPALDRLAQHGFDGAILVQPSAPPEEYQDLVAAGVRAVLIEPATDPVPDLPAVTCANAEGARRAARHLADLGHTRVAVLAGDPTHPLTRARLRGVHQALEATTLRHCDDLDSARATARTLLRTPAPPTAILAFGDHLAAGALQAARSLGVDVPGRLSVIGFDDGTADLLAPALTVVRRPLAELGAAAARLLLDRESRSLDLPTDLVVRASTAAVPES
ncbi:substrate-binding domain-containing protein [Spirillospora sp. CA-294931]|uniref:substrate-binding domain-containing protein n=1 Tax=Spirillospora sp. CA-294931 TaxID=3240042 RepID=UPI003D9119FC